MNNCFTCKHEFQDKERSGDDHKLCRVCWDGPKPKDVVEWINANIINYIGMCSNKSRNCPGWEGHDKISHS